MQLIYPKLRASDILVLATPVYVPLPREMQDFLNRLMPLIQPLLSYKHGRTRARFHKSVRIAKIVLVSTSGWWELGNFGTVLRIAREFAEDVSVKFAGALLRPHCHEALVHEEISSQIFQAAERAGFELVSKGKIDEHTLDIISQPVISEKEYRRINNEGFKEDS